MMRKPLPLLILVTVALTLLGSVIPQLRFYLALSWVGIDHLYLWQLITYVFVEPNPLSLNLLIQLGFNMYILWMFGSSLIERSRNRLFFLLYFGAALVGGLSALPYYPHLGLAGSATAVYAVLVAWMMINEGAQLLLFFTLPFKAHWLVVGLLGFSLFVEITANQWAAASSLVASSLYGYFFALITWRQLGPFALFHSFERKLIRFLERKKGSSPQPKIYDIKSGNPVLDDEQFMDAMLDQISRQGEGSLTPDQRNRMKTISERKK